MRIVALVHFYVPVHMAGSETMLHAMLAELARAGHDVHVLVTRESEAASHFLDGVHVHRGVDVDALAIALASDVLVTHHAEVHRTKRLALRLGCRLVHLLHSDAELACRWTAAQQPDLVVFNTQWVADAFHEAHGAPRSSIIVHPPIDPARHLVTPGSKVTLVNLSEAKGARVFYGLARDLPHVEFLGVVGGYDDQIIEQLPNVEIHPHTADPREFWAKTRLLLIPSAHESFGMVGIEAAVSGIPAIAHPTPGLLESLGSAGTFAHRTLLSEWTDAVQRLLQPDEWAAASERARARAAELTRKEGLQRWVTAVERLST